MFEQRYIQLMHDILNLYDDAIKSDEVPEIYKLRLGILAGIIRPPETEE